MQAKPSPTVSPYFHVVDAYRLRWLDVPYEPGELRTVAYKDGRPIGEATVRTAGQPAQLRLTADRTKLRADGMDLSYVTIEMLDADGNLCPLAMDGLTFEVTGAAKLMGVANGNPMGFDAFTDNTHPLFYGKAVAVLRSIPGQPGLRNCKWAPSRASPPGNNCAYPTDTGGMLVPERGRCCPRFRDQTSQYFRRAAPQPVASVYDRR